METRTSLFFPPFWLDLETEQLWREDQPIALRPKTFAVLRSLVEHPGRVVTKDELLDAVWGQTVVSDTVLKSCIRELRTALGDDAQTPQYIATVHRRGYRFIAPLTTAPPPCSLEFRVPRLASQDQNPQSYTVRTLDPRRQTLDVPLVGRESELAQLHGWLEKALRGERQIVFVTGEPGIGKTTLVDAFLHQLGGQPLWLGRGQCIEQYGAGEAQHPALAPSTHAEAEAEVCFWKAIDIAQQQQAKSLGLRATMSLARLWHQQGKQTEARQMLAKIYDWFTEGFDTATSKKPGRCWQS
jgi:DNA-binding winged helix-turn-helix (wHTH) protein